MTDVVDELIGRSDLDELVRLAGRMADVDDWDALADLAVRSRRAHEQGHQLWPAAERAHYLLALLAPASHAGAVVTDGAGRFALGPLTEVIAQDHPWADLRTHLAAGPSRGIVAHERIVRGEDLADDAVVAEGHAGVPGRLQAWEPAYPLAEYAPDEASFPRPDLPALDATPLPGAGGAQSPDDGTRALAGLVAAWVDDSDGHCETVAVHGDAFAAVAALARAPARMAAVTAADALAHMAWAAASGGAHGRRRGMAAGRFEALWTAATLGGLDDEWPPEPDDLGDAVSELEWWVWDTGEPDTGWHLGLAVHDPLDDLAWAITARDPAP